jgi:hypothetical protein
VSASSPDPGRGAGCLQWAVAAPVLALLSPLAMGVRAWRTWRRGAAVIVERAPRAIVRGAAGPMTRLELDVDVPHGRERQVGRRLTDTVVRAAEALRRADDAYHLTYRQPQLGETTQLPVGPQVQELGERLALALAQRDLEGRTVLWLTMARRLSPGPLVDPFTYDPEAPGEPEPLVLREGVRWALASARGTAAASTVYRLVFWVPEAAAGKVEEVLDRLQSHLRAGE